MDYQTELKVASERSYYSASAEEFSKTSPEQIIGILALKHGFDLDLGQRSAWKLEVESLAQMLAGVPSSYLFLEFSIPRMGKRADAILLLEGIIFVLEYKTNSSSYDSGALDQVLDYALDLKNFHEGSHRAHIVPILIATHAPDVEPKFGKWGDGILTPIRTNLSGALAAMKGAVAFIGQDRSDRLPSPVEWAGSRYKPTPTIVEAAQALYRGHSVQEISRSEAGAENLTRTTGYINGVIDDTRRRRKKAICFVTGVPGSGKTLAGLTLANARMKIHDDEHAVFLSGNGPLVDVLRAALADDEVERASELNHKVRRADAERSAKAFIQNIHHFRDEYLNGQVPIEKVVVFDEAQRAWTKEQASSFMSRKRDRKDFNQSEPDFLLSVMDRHHDWCAVVCLIGGGQEINTGEAGLSEWLQAVETNFPHWEVHISDRLSSQDYLGQALSESHLSGVTRSSELHLAVSVRSFRAEALSDFVGALLAGELDRAKTLISQLLDFPIVLTRELETARSWLKERARGTERTGLVASSNALRLKPVGLHVRAAIDPPVWFLAPNGDVRSSYALEDVATEFDIQGLELDWVGVCWDANLRFAAGHWETWKFQGTRWQKVQDNTRASYLINSYRVLLTRARQGMVIFVPRGSEEDQTRPNEVYDDIFELLNSLGISVAKV